MRSRFIRSIVALVALVVAGLAGSPAVGSGGAGHPGRAAPPAPHRPRGIPAVHRAPGAPAAQHPTGTASPGPVARAAAGPVAKAARAPGGRPAAAGRKAGTRVRSAVHRAESGSSVAYVANEGPDSLSVVDVSTGTVTGTISLVGLVPDPMGFGVSPLNPAVTPDGSKVYVPVIADMGGGAVVVIDAATNAVSSVIGGFSGPRDLVVSPDGSRAYVADTGGGRLAVIDTATDTVTASIGVSVPWAVAVSPDGLHVYATEDFAPDVAVISTVTDTVTATVPVGRDPQGIAVTPDGASLYVTSVSTDTVWLVDTASNTVTRTIPVGAGPCAVAASPDGATAYVTNEIGTAVSVISTSTNTVTATVPVGSYPMGLEFTPDGSTVYVTNLYSSSVSVIGTRTQTVTATVAVGSFPMGVAFVPPPAPLSVTTSSLGSATRGTPYSATVAASGGTAPYSWTVFSGSLPTGLSLNAGTGAVTGTPTGPTGDVSFTVRVTDAAMNIADQSLTVTVVDPLVVTTTVLPVGVIGTPYPASLAAVGGTAPYTWSVHGGTLPAGLSLDAGTGAVTGTPTGPAGQAGFTVRVTDAAARTADRSLTVRIASGLTVTTPVLPAGVIGTPYSVTLVAGGGSAPYTWSVHGGGLPAGLSLNAGAVTGTPTGPAGRAGFTVRVTDAIGNTADLPLTLVVDGAAAPAPTSVTLTGGTSVIFVSWTVPPSSGVTGYTATAEPGGATCHTTSASSTSCVLGAVAGTTYTVSVVAHTGGGDLPPSAPSNPVTATAPVPPATAPQAGAVLTTDKGPIDTIRPGERITFLGTALCPFSTVVISLYSSPVVLAVVVTDAAGNFTAPVTIPAGLDSGRHTVLAQGVAPDGTPRQLILSVAATATTAGLATTGFAAATTALTGLILAAAGIALRAGLHRRREPTIGSR